MDHDIDLNNTPLVEKNTLSNFVENALVAEETSRWDFLVLTIPFFGLQLAWTVQQVFGVPYLSSLGISDTQMPMFVLSGPLAGLVGPPVVAALSDTCQSPWGKRKPFIFLGGLGTILSFLLLAAARPLAVTLAYSVLDQASPNAATTTSHIIAGLSIYALNFSIQPLQLGLRASVVDHFGPHQQPTANLWISRFSALGSIFVALVGLGYSPAFWHLSIVVTSVLALLLGVVALTNTTKAGSQWSDRGKDAGPISLCTHVSRLLRKARHLPPITRRTCRVQLVSWFAWFLVLNYTSALISRIYNKPNILDVQSKPPSTPPSVSANAVSRVALLFHTAALATLVIVSMVWRRSGNRNDHAKTRLDAYADNDETGIHHGSGIACTHDILMHRVWKPCLAALVASLVGTCLLADAATLSPPAATTISLLLGANGILFALANWVPYALIAHEASAQARSRVMMTAEGDTMDDEDDTPKLLAVHNMAITVPQMVASVTSWLVMQGLAVLGLEQNVVWIFVMCIPSALWAACL